jgi:hypothetical protein
VVRRCLELNAAAVVFAHNHPSGVTEPSKADEDLTDRLKTALAMFDVRVLDHFIVGGASRPVSFAEGGCYDRPHLHPGPWRRVGHRTIAAGTGPDTVTVCEVFSGGVGLDQADANEA